MSTDETAVARQAQAEHSSDDERSAESVIGRVCAFSLERAPEAMPQSARETAARLLLDTLGIGAAAAPMEAGRIARETARLLYGTAEPAYAARMLFDGRTASVAGAAYAAATQIDNLDGHDGYNPTKGHIGVAVVPALVALAQHRPDLSGPEALAALIVGYEVAGRAGIALHATVSDYHTSGAWNALGVAALAARLRGLDARTLREALGIAEYHGPRSQMMREIAHPTMLHDGSGWGALAGVSAAILAERGSSGAPALTIEGSEVVEHWADLGRFWQIEHQYVKPYPVCRWAHPAIDAARELRAAHGVEPAQITGVRVHTFANAARLFARMPETTSQAQYSLPFAVACMLVHGRIGLEQIAGAALADRRVEAIVARTTVAEAHRHERRFPAGRWADVELLLDDGRALRSGDTEARGGPSRPFDTDAVVAKFTELAAPVLGERRARALREATLGLVDPSSRFADLSTHLLEAP